MLRSPDTIQHMIHQLHSFEQNGARVSDNVEANDSRRRSRIFDCDQLSLHPATSLIHGRNNHRVRKSMYERCQICRSWRMSSFLQVS